MKNSLVISATGEDLISSVNDGTNALFINDSEIDSSEWVGSGTYTATVEGYAITITKVADLTGNVILQASGDYSYSLTNILSADDELTNTIINVIEDQPLKRLVALLDLANNGTDLNTITALGEYSCGLSATARTLLNTPWGDASSSAVAFRLVVERAITLNNTAYIRQTLTAYNSPNRWTRTTQNGGSTWGSWSRVDANLANYLTVADELTGFTDVSSALTASDTSKMTIANLKLYALGDLRILQGYATAVNLASGTTTIATIASGHRPKNNIGLGVYWNANRYDTIATAGQGGSIAIRSGAAYTSGNLYLNAAWVVA